MRKITAGSVRVDGKVITDPKAYISPADGSVLQLGKRKWGRIRIGHD